jgi:hypothetical protein
MPTSLTRGWNGLAGGRVIILAQHGCQRPLILDEYQVLAWCALPRGPKTDGGVLIVYRAMSTSPLKPSWVQVGEFPLLPFSLNYDRGSTILIHHVSRKGTSRNPTRERASDEANHTFGHCAYPEMTNQFVNLRQVSHERGSKASDTDDDTICDAPPNLPVDSHPCSSMMAPWPSESPMRGLPVRSCHHNCQECRLRVESPSLVLVVMQYMYNLLPHHPRANKAGESRLPGQETGTY